MDNFFKDIRKNKMLLFVVFLLIMHLYYSKQLYIKVTGGDIEYILGFKHYPTENNTFWTNIVLLMGFTIPAMNLAAFIGLVFKKFWGWILSSICILYYLLRELNYVVAVIIREIEVYLNYNTLNYGSAISHIFTSSSRFIIMNIFLIFCLYNRSVYQYFTYNKVSKVKMSAMIALTIALLLIDRIAHSLWIKH